MERRHLDFRTWADVLAEVEHLQQGGFVRAGSWDLAQTCDHLTYFIAGSLDGYTFRVPWFLRLFGPWALRRILKTRRMPTGIKTPQQPLPPPGADEAAAVRRFRQVVERFRAAKGELHPSPFFGPLTPAQWHELHLIHCAHHLGFLQPKESGPGAAPA